MTATTVTYVRITCDVCGEEFKSADDGVPLFDSAAEAAKDAAHQAALDAMMPPEPAQLVDGQVELDYTSAEEGPDCG